MNEVSTPKCVFTPSLPGVEVILPKVVYPSFPAATYEFVPTVLVFVSSIGTHLFVFTSSTYTFFTLVP